MRYVCEQIALETANKQRLESGYYDQECEDDRRKRKPTILYGGDVRTKRGKYRRKIVIDDDNEYEDMHGFCVPDDYIEYVDADDDDAGNRKRIPLYDLTGDDEDAVEANDEK
eukprot:4038_1